MQVKASPFKTRCLSSIPEGLQCGAESLASCRSAWQDGEPAGQKRASAGLFVLTFGVVCPAAGDIGRLKMCGVALVRGLHLCNESTTSAWGTSLEQVFINVVFLFVLLAMISGCISTIVVRTAYEKNKAPLVCVFQVVVTLVHVWRLLY